MALVGLLVKAIGLGTFFLVVQYVLAYLRSPLKSIPGPFLAKFSNAWRFLNHYGQTHIETQRKLHEQHGDVVRLGPNTVSVSDASLIKTIYNIRGTYLKNALQIESIMDDDLRTLCAQLESRFIEDANKGKTCDIADWISFFAWDFLGDMTWSQRIGFMEQGMDVGDMLGTAERVMRYFSVVGQIPALDKWLGKNPKWPRFLYKFDDFSVAAGFSVQRFMERMQNPELGKGKKDFLNGFLEAKKEHPELVTDNEVIGYMIINSPASKARLVEELRSANLSFPAPYTSIEKLPYLDACIKEGLRMHPVIGHILERVVPNSGLTLPNGTIVPPGTIIGVNPWVIHYKEDIYGERPHEFRPERWMRAEKEDGAAYEARIRKMKDADMAFGGGNRVCIGKPLALVEVYKVVATVFGKYKIDLEHPSKEWDLNKQWFVWPHNIKVKLDMLDSASP
ncbi:cytochrome p450 [Stemphylium lycopersici]|nr:cytochrome p450 [Stemphylium lycopersici]